MAATGPQWSLYPLLAVVSFCAFFLGVLHLSFCLPFYFLCIPLVNGFLGLLASFHALFLRYPNRCDFVLQLVCTTIGFWFLVASSLESYCISKGETFSEGVCYGVQYRTQGLVGSCMDLIGHLQLSFLAKINWEPKDRDYIRIFVSYSLTIAAAVQLICTTALTFYSAIETKLRLYSYHYQIVVASLTCIAGLFHLRYCCTFFYFALPLAIGVFCIIAGTVAWKTRCHGTPSRSLSVISSALALLLLASTLFGVFCWFNRKATPHGITLHCSWHKGTENYCFRVINFSHPYIDWNPDEVDKEIAVIQIAIYIFLSILSLLQFTFSMKSAFSTRDVELYY